VTRTLSYDPLNRLNVYNPGTLRRFVYDGNEAAAELDSAGAIQNRYVIGDGPDEVLVDYVGSGTTSRRFLSTDERGSVVSQTDSSGALIGIDTYDEYGKPGAANQGRFQYTGQKWLSEIGAYDYKARVYLPHLGVFAQTDPIGQQDSPNLYAYVGDDPVNYVDPLGLRWVMACVGVPGGVPNCGLHWIADENPPGDTSRLDPNLRNENGRDRLSGGVVNPNPIFVICDAVCRARRALGFRRREIPGVWFASDCVIRGTCRAGPQPNPKPRDRSLCAALAAGAAGYVIGNEAKEAAAVRGFSLFSRMLTGGEFGAEGGGGVFSLEGAAAGAAIGGATYFLDKNLNHAGANALARKEGICR
jgi:RHS repeat-associated protein